MLGERADFEFRCFYNVNRFRNPGNTLSPHSADAPTSNYGKHPYHIEHASSPVLAVFASPPLRRGRHFTFPQRGLPRQDHRICANVRSPSSVCASRAGLAVSHLFCLGGGARNLVCLPRRTRSPVRFRFGYSTSMLGVLPHIFSRFPAPPRSLRCAGDNVRATSFASASDAQSRPLSRAGTVSAYLRSRAEDRLRQMCAASPAFPHRV